MNENDLLLVKEYNFDNPPCNEMGFVKDCCFRDCHLLFS